MAFGECPALRRHFRVRMLCTPLAILWHPLTSFNGLMVCHPHTITIILISLISHADTSQRLISVLPMHCIIQDCAKTHDYRSNLEFIAKGHGGNAWGWHGRGGIANISSGGMGRRWGALLTIRYILNVYRDFWIIEYFWGIFWMFIGTFGSSNIFGVYFRFHFPFPISSKWHTNSI